jgi:hypothetical protein
MEKLFLTRDNYYGADTVLFNLTFRDQTEKSFTIRFAPVAIVPRRRITLQKEWPSTLWEVPPPFPANSFCVPPSPLTSAPVYRQAGSPPKGEGRRG